MSIITAADLNGKRRVHDWLLPDTCAILRAASVETSGGTSQDWNSSATVASGVRCHYSEEPQTAAEREIAARLAAPAVGRVELPALTDVQEADRLRVTLESGSTDFEVRWSSGRTSWEIGVTVLVTAVNG